MRKPKRNQRNRALLSMALLLAGATFSRPASAKVAKVAVLDVRAVGTFDAKSVQGLSSLIATEAEKRRVKVVSGADISALVRFDRQRTLLGCNDESCMVEIGGALGVDFLLYTEVSEVGGVWLLSMSLLDVVRARAIRRLTRQTDSVRDLIDVARSATAEALEAIRIVRRVPPPSAAGPERAAMPTESAVTSSSPSRRLLYLVPGATLIACGVVAGAFALSTYNDAKKASGAQLSDLRSTGKTQALAADLAYAAGVLALSGGLYFAYQASEGSSSSLVFGAAPTPGGAMAVVSGGY
jgi:hypothetical protein